MNPDYLDFSMIWTGPGSEAEDSKSTLTSKIRRGYYDPARRPFVYPVAPEILCQPIANIPDDELEEAIEARKEYKAACAAADEIKAENDAAVMRLYEEFRADLRAAYNANVPLEEDDIIYNTASTLSDKTWGGTATAYKTLVEMLTKLTGK